MFSITEVNIKQKEYFSTLMDLSLKKHIKQKEYFITLMVLFLKKHNK